MTHRRGFLVGMAATAAGLLVPPIPVYGEDDESEYDEFDRLNKELHAIITSDTSAFDDDAIDWSIPSVIYVHEVDISGSGVFWVHYADDESIALSGAYSNNRLFLGDRHPDTSYTVLPEHGLIIMTSRREML